MLWSNVLLASEPSAPITGQSITRSRLQWADFTFGTERADGTLPGRHQAILHQDLDGILLGQRGQVLDGARPLQPVHTWCLRALANVRCGHPCLALGDFGRRLLAHLLLQKHSSLAFLSRRKPLRGLLLGMFHHACDGFHTLHSNCDPSVFAFNSQKLVQNLITRI